MDIKNSTNLAFNLIIKKIFSFLIIFFLYVNFATAQIVSSTDSLNNFITDDSLKTKIEKDTLIPLLIKSLTSDNYSGINTSYEKLIQRDYRTTADFFSHFPFGLKRDFGSLGTPDEVMIYGNGFGSLNIMENGIPVNNAISNSYDMNNLLSESIDSIEVIPLVRGFLYGINNSPVSINFLSRELISPIPYSRIKFYQAPFEEGQVDFLYNMFLNKKLNFLFNLSNASIDSRYKNSEYGLWKGKAELKYLFSNSIALTTSYKHVKSNKQLNGGVNLTEIPEIYFNQDVNSILYDEILAPVNFINRYQKITEHDLRIKLQLKFTKSIYSEANIYYNNYLQEFRQNEKFDTTTQKDIPTLFNNNKSVSSGINFRSNIDLDYFTVDAGLNFENNKFATDILTSDEQLNIFSIYSKVDVYIFENTRPAFYAKYLNHDERSYKGFGADIGITLLNGLHLFAGSSFHEKPLNIIESRTSFQDLSNNKISQTNLEIGVQYKTGMNSVYLGFFHQKVKNDPLPVFLESYISIRNSHAAYFEFVDNNFSGINLNIESLIGVIGLEFNGAYYPGERPEKNNLPDYTLTGGIYYIDTLFNSNLQLKTGLNAKLNGDQYELFYDFQKNISSYKKYSDQPDNSLFNGYNIIGKNFTMDFFLAGKIRERAILYFVFENILGIDYYITNYYPMPSRGLRFGVAWELYN